jgi:hypothetical protein
LAHNQQIGFDPNMMKQDLTMMNQMNVPRLPSMGYQSNIMPNTNMMHFPGMINNIFPQQG